MWLMFLVLNWVVRSFLFFLFCLLLAVIASQVYRAFHSLRGRRNRDRGIPCVECQRTAFPVAGFTTLYRSAICHCRFSGPEHW
jgi:hypothetical protein